MTKNTDTGHVKNVANFEMLLTACSAQSVSYNPSNPTLSIASLKAVLADAKAKLKATNDAQIELTLTINHRQDAFKPLAKLITRVLNALEACGASDSYMYDARSLADKIRGNNNKKKTSDSPDLNSDTIVKRSKSTSQRSFDLLTEHFSKFITMLEELHVYVPNEEELKINSLKKYQKELNDLNQRINEKKVLAQQFLIERDHVLYAPETGLVPIANTVKQYIRSIYGIQSPQNQNIKSLIFRSPNK